MLCNVWCHTNGGFTVRSLGLLNSPAGFGGRCGTLPGRKANWATRQPDLDGHVLTCLLFICYVLFVFCSFLSVLLCCGCLLFCLMLLLVFFLLLSVNLSSALYLERGVYLCCVCCFAVLLPLLMLLLLLCQADCLSIHALCLLFISPLIAEITRSFSVCSGEALHPPSQPLSSATLFPPLSCSCHEICTTSSNNCYDSCFLKVSVLLPKLLF